MANTITGLFQTVVAEACTASDHLKFSNALLGSVFMDYQPIPATPFTTLNVNIPTVNESDAVNIGSGDLQPTDTAHTTVPIVYDQNFSTSFVIRSWDEFRTPENLRQKYIKPRLESLLRAANSSIAALITAGNFNTPDSGAGADKFTRDDFASCWQALADVGAPVEDAGNLFFVTSPKAYSKTTADSSFCQEAIVGVNAAEAAQQKAMIAPQFNAEVRWDQKMVPINTGKELGIFMHRSAIAMVTAAFPKTDATAIQETTIYPRPGFPVQIQVGYDMIKRGYVVALNASWGVKVVRPNLARLIETA